MDHFLNFQELFKGFQNTPLLWKTSAIYKFEQFPIEQTTEKFVEKSEHKKLRLGKWVEKFVTFQLQQNANINILEENLIIKDGKQTIGELDVLLLKENEPIHLEIIYKFYLYDTLCDYQKPLAYWIGPNRKDTLLYKLDKLKSKQFPLLHHKLTQSYLEKHNLKKESIKQQICFKAQLFLPYNFQDITIKPLNKDCIVGFYISFSVISIFKNLEFYIPKKLDWLTIPHNNVEWLDFEQATIEITEFINKKQSPLIWLKYDADNLKKCFITWW